MIPSIIAGSNSVSVDLRRRGLTVAFGYMSSFVCEADPINEALVFCSSSSEYRLLEVVEGITPFDGYGKTYWLSRCSGN